MKEKVLDQLKTQFRPEFVNRIDEIVVFHALDEKHIEGIAAIQLQRLIARLAKMDIALEVSPAALTELARAGFDPVYGARLDPHSGALDVVWAFAGEWCGLAQSESPLERLHDRPGHWPERAIPSRG